MLWKTFHSMVLSSPSCYDGFTHEILSVSVLIIQDPLKRDQMIQLRNQDSFLGEEIKRARQELRNLENRQRELEIEIQNDPSKQTMILLSQELQQYQQRRSELMGELDPSTAGGSIEDEKQKILAHVRELKAETESMQKDVFRMEEEIQSMRVRVDGSMDDVSSNSASNFGNDATLMEFVQRDKQLTNFIESVSSFSTVVSFSIFFFWFWFWIPSLLEKYIENVMFSTAQPFLYFHILSRKFVLKSLILQRKKR